MKGTRQKRIVLLSHTIQRQVKCGRAPDGRYRQQGLSQCLQRPNLLLISIASRKPAVLLHTPPGKTRRNFKSGPLRVSAGHLRSKAWQLHSTPQSPCSYQVVQISPVRELFVRKGVAARCVERGGTHGDPASDHIMITDAAGALWRVSHPRANTGSEGAVGMTEQACFFYFRKLLLMGSSLGCFRGIV